MDQPLSMENRDRERAFGDSRERILQATAEVLARRGTTKLNLSEVAQQADLSRMTIYRFFASKEDLVNAFTRWESDKMEESLLKATAGLRGAERLDATLKFIVRFQLAHSGLRMFDLEPGEVILRLSGLMPVLGDRLKSIIPGPNPALAASTVMRVAMSHYLLPDDDADRFLAELRYAAGLYRPTTE
ncbi:MULTISPECIES: helix-turn-helix domain-containing protein [unclassified Mycobacterium]|uniref:TetR/AcrR family transcriptional regulator n=1 Tax=unclassified Mycobacterium TaxID=2642494 RepID=UPI0029C87020|nr:MULTISPECIES: helix-turn-helix domain-containing protein [unclassified Mycobacterium]